ncbi:hypothetical protein MRX96_024456 [Rhipicephalus microplus]
MRESNHRSLSPLADDADCRWMRRRRHLDARKVVQGGEIAEENVLPVEPTCGLAFRLRLRPKPAWLQRHWNLALRSIN